MDKVIDRQSYVVVHDNRDISGVNFTGQIVHDYDIPSNLNVLKKKSYYVIKLKISQYRTAQAAPVLPAGYRTLGHELNTAGLSNNLTELFFTQANFELNDVSVSAHPHYPHSTIVSKSISMDRDEIDSRNNPPFTIATPLNRYTLHRRITCTDTEAEPPTYDEGLSLPATLTDNANHRIYKAISNVVKSQLLFNNASVTFPFPFGTMNAEDDIIYGNNHIRTTFIIDPRYKEGVILSTTGPAIDGAPIDGHIKFEVVSVELYLFTYQSQGIIPNQEHKTRFTDVFSTYQPVRSSIMRTINLPKNTHKLAICMFPNLRSSFIDNGTFYCQGNSYIRTLRVSYAGTQFPRTDYYFDADPAGVLPANGDDAQRAYQDYCVNFGGSSGTTMMSYNEWLGNMLFLFDVSHVPDIGGEKIALIECEFLPIAVTDDSILHVSAYYDKELTIEYGENMIPEQTFVNEI